MVVVSYATANPHSYLLLPLPFPLQLIGTLSVLSHFTEPMRFIILSKKSFSLVLLCFKRGNIMTPLVVSVIILLTINMSKLIHLNADTRQIGKTGRYFAVKISTSAITRTFAWSRRSRYNRVPLYKYQYLTLNSYILN